MEGLMIRGTLKRLELPTDSGGFANVTIETHRSNGEPKWMRAAFPVTQRNSPEPTQLAIDLGGIEMDSLIELEVSCRTSAKGTPWTLGHKVEDVTPGRAKRSAPLTAARANGQPASSPAA